VPDPWYGPEPGFHEVFKMINEVCDVIIKKYTPQPPKGGVGSNIIENNFQK
jgi:protein-tyrosine phosphatase